MGNWAKNAFSVLFSILMISPASFAAMTEKQKAKFEELKAMMDLMSNHQFIAEKKTIGDHTESRNIVLDFNENQKESTRFQVTLEKGTLGGHLTLGPEIFKRPTDIVAPMALTIGMGYADSIILAEAYKSAEAGSLNAKAAVLHYVLMNLENGESKLFLDMINMVSEYQTLESQDFKDLYAKMEKELEMVKAQAAKENRAGQKRIKAFRETGVLEKLESQSQKLDDLLLANDRKGVRDMIDAYLPWDVMEPVEKQAWKIWLEAIEHPNWKDSVVAFRGIDYNTDKVQRGRIQGQDRLGFFSTMLTKNQGSYTRRLRSLSTSRLENGSKGTYLISESPSVTVSSLMISHASNPRGSIFLSFSYDPFIASSFMGKKKAPQDSFVGNGGLLAVRMDSRRLFPNLPSSFHNEAELLAALIVFPDEVVRYEESPEAASDKAVRREFAKNFAMKVTEATGVQFQLNQDDGTRLRPETVKEFINKGTEFFNQTWQKAQSSRVQSCSTVLLD